MRTPLPLLATLSLVAVAGCDPRQAPPPLVAADPVKVMATVNGVPITERDVEHRATRPGMRAAPGHDAAASGAVLQTVVRDELLSQKAVQLGLDRDPSYRLAMDDLEAQVRVFRRQQLQSRLRAWVQEQVAVSDAEAREWFDRNAALVGTRFHVQQLRGTLDELRAAQAELAAGAPFEEVAGRRFQGMAQQGRAPWDLGEVVWNQLPAPWRGVVDRLEPGQVSGLIPWDAERAWLVKLVGKRTDPGITFETERERIATSLRQGKADELYAKLVAEAQAKALVVYPAGGGRAAVAREGTPAREAP